MLVSGADSADFLQAQLTSDVLALGPGAGQLSARLGRRGLLQAWFSLHRLPDRGQPFPVFLCVLPQAEIPALVADLQKFVITEDVVVEDYSDELSGWVGQIPAAGSSPGGPAPALPWRAVGSDSGELEQYAVRFHPLPAGGEVWLIRRPLAGDPGWLLLVPGGAHSLAVPPEWQAAITAHGLVDLAGMPETEAHTLWHWLTAEAGWPRLPADLAPASRLLTQTGLDHFSVSFSKGCYLGQEVVSRVRTYGSAPEALRAVLWRDLTAGDMDRLPAAGKDFLTAEGRRCGTFASTFWAPTLQQVASLVFLGREDRTPGARLSLTIGPDELVGEVALLPLHQGADDGARAAWLHDQALRNFAAGRDQAAAVMLEESLRLDATNAEAFEALGVILGRQQKFHEAIDIFRRLEEVAPEEPMVHTNLSLFYMKIGDREEAERQKALGTMKRFGVGTTPAAAAELAAREAGARTVEAERKRAMFAEVLALDPDDALALMGMGQALADLGETAAAADHLRRALANQADNSALHVSYGRMLGELGRIDEAAEVYRRGIVVASRRGDLMPLREMEHRLQLLAR